MADSAAAKDKRVLLPTTVQPVLYKIHLTPNMKDFTFAGHEDIEVVVKSATTTIALHALEVTIKSAKLLNSGLVAKTLDYNKENETYTLDFGSAVPVGSETLSIDFEGQLNDKMAGFYRSKYVVNGETRYLATTQFEPVDARRAFPCWDEPAVKAKFQVTLTFADHLLALNNMPVAEEKHDKDAKLKTVTFQPTPVMSSYLLAFVIGEFDVVEGVTKAGVKFRVFTPLGKADKGKFALDVGIKVLDYFSEYFNLPYPLPKMDMIAIPDFAAGAMENWGLITYRETALLCDETSSVAARSRVAYVVAHELAHQWFGNLVTMEWWQQLYLNEGFATFIGNQAVDKFFPEWDIWTQFVSQYLFNALRLDSLLSSHPIEVEIHRSREIDSIFDAISYSKGASVIRMLSAWLGEAAFRKGLQIYLARHQYTNAITQDLWKAWEEASGKPVSQMMTNWTFEVGYPYVSVSREKSGHGHAGCCLKANQERFLGSGKPTADQDKTTWQIKLPVSSAATNGAIEFFDLDSKSKSFDLDAKFAEGWLKANAGQSSVVRVAYSADLLKQLKQAVSSKTLKATDRLGLQNDQFALAKAGHVSLSLALDLAQAYVDETDYSVWSDLSANLGGFAAVWSSETDVSEHVKVFTRQLYAKIGGHLGWDHKDGQTDLDKLLRAVVLSKLGDNGDQAVVEEAKKRFNAFLKDPSSLAGDLRLMVFKFVMRNGGKAEYDQMVKLFETSEAPEDKINALRAIGLSKEPALIQAAIDYAMGGAVRNQDVYVLLAATASTAPGRDLTWNYLKANFATFKERFTGGLSMLSYIIKFSANDFTTNEKADEVEQFFKANTADGIERTVAQVVENIRSNAAWVDRHRVDVRTFLHASIKLA